MSENEEPGYAWTDMEWGADAGPWRYQILSASDVAKQLRLHANAKFDASTSISSVTFQPCLNDEYRSQDRLVVQNWNLRGGEWRFVAVFDGHAGHETVDHAAVEVPLRLKSDLETALEDSDGTFPSHSVDQVSNILTKTIAAYDESLLDDLSSIFPGGLDSVLELPDDKIDSIINDANCGGENLKKVHRCMRGSTALVCLVDPTCEHLWVANLGDCRAILGTKCPDGTWEATSMTSDHNGENEAEVTRVRDEHPGETECILRQRVLGAIAVTRALGDYVFKLPPIFTKKIFLQAKPGFNFKSSINQWISRNHTPPYLSHQAEVHHCHITSEKKKTGNQVKANTVLIICSDGLTDLYRKRTEDFTHWVELVGPVGAEGGNAALALLRNALGGDDLDTVSRYLTLENTERWMDDTTVAVMTF